MADFIGFTDRTIPLLEELPDFTRDDYAERKPDVVADITDPAKAFVDAMIDELQETVSPGITGAAKVNGSISPLNNDLRFAKAGTPLYKDHLLLWFWEGPSKKTSPLLAIRIHATGVGFASGMGFDKDQLERWRLLVASEAGTEIAALVQSIEKKGGELDGQTLKRVPAPHDEDHPRAALLKYKSAQLRYVEPVPTSVTKASFVGWCGKRLARLEPLHRVFVDEIA